MRQASVDPELSSMGQTFLGLLGPSVGHRMKLCIGSVLLFFGNMFSGDLLGLISVPQVMMDEGSWILSCMVFILYGVLATLEHMTLDSLSSRSNLSLQGQGRISLKLAASKRSPVPLLGTLGLVTVLTIAAYNASFEYMYFPEPVLNLLNPISTLLLSSIAHHGWETIKIMAHQVPQEDEDENGKYSSGINGNPKRLQLFAFLLTSVALGIMTFPGHKLMSHGSSPSQGVFLTILTSLGIGTIATLQELAVNGYSMSPAEVISHSSLFAAMAILMSLIASGSLVTSFQILASEDPENRPAGVFWVAAIGYCVTRVYFAILSHYGAAIAISCAAAAEAFFKLSLKVVLLAEPLMIRYIWSGVAIIIGLYLATSRQSTSTKKPLHHRRQHSSMSIA